MRGIYKNLGVTLLEMILVIEVASMIFMMAVKFYRSATASHQVNAAITIIEAITASADSLSLGTGSYVGISTGAIRNLMPNKSMKSPWGGDITISGASITSHSYQVIMEGTPRAVCYQLKSRLVSNNKYTGMAGNTCAAVGAFLYTYDNQL